MMMCAMLKIGIWGSPVFKTGATTKSRITNFPESNKSLAYWGEEVNGGYKYEGRTCILLENSALHKNVKIEKMQ